MTTKLFQHQPVMTQEIMELLRPVSGGLYLDGTIGGGGHARMILDSSAPDGFLVGLDRDPEALTAAAKQLASYGDRVVFRHCNFAEMSRCLDELGISEVDGILLDIGVSSFQLDSPKRGFSFREDGPLDMRMDPTTGLTAGEVIAESSVEELNRIFRDYGEERWARRIAREIVTHRNGEPLKTTLQLAELVSRVVPGGKRSQRIHPATRVFQALRIYVNRELESLAAGVQSGIRRLKLGGRMVVVCFHSLEDRLVKQSFRDAATECTCPPRMAVCGCGQTPTVRLLNRRGIRASEQEVTINPRARSAVLRGIERIL